MNRTSHRIARRAGLAAVLLGAVCIASPAHTAQAADAAAKQDKPQDIVKPLKGDELSRFRTRDEGAKSSWRVVSGVKVDPNNPKNLFADPEAKGDQKILLLEKSQKGADLITDADVSDAEVHLEFMIPKGSNSGVYLMGQYEVQILDSFGKKTNQLKPGDMGGVYNTQAPNKNATKAPGEWQTLDIVFNAPRFGPDGKKTENARFVSVKLNGETILENVVVKQPTGGQLPGGEKPTGPIMIQGDHGPIAIRALSIRPIEVGGPARTGELKK